MTTSHLIFSVDYELFGNGSGCIEHCVLNPAEVMMRVAEKYHLPVTFFVEALEFMSVEQHLGDYRVAGQMKKALERGHDVQLHLHPQWDNAQLDSMRQSWNLNMDNWRIGDLAPDRISRLLGDGKQWIESVAGSNKPGFKVNTFRAGGWCIQPSSAVIQALGDLDFDIDSTVAPGQWRSGKGEWSNFRNAPKMPYWLTKDDVLTPGNAGIYEVPITTGGVNYIKSFGNLFRVRRTGSSALAPGCSGSYIGANSSLQKLVAKTARFAQLGSGMLDISTQPFSVLVDITRQWQNKYEGSVPVLPIVSIAHTKNFSQNSEKVLRDYLCWAQDQGMVFSSYNQWLRAINESK